MNALTGVLIDTNVLSYMFQRSPLGIHYERLRAGQLAFVACVTPEELYFGAEKKKWGPRKRRDLDALIAEYVVIPGDLGIARMSARVRAERERVGRALERADAWIAATALDYGLPLFTHDGDFEGIKELRIVTALESWSEGTIEPESLIDAPPIKAAAIAPVTYRLQ